MGINMISKIVYCLLGVIILSPFPAYSFPYQPMATVQIVSESAADSGDSLHPDTYFWKVVAKSGQSDGSLTLSFFRRDSDMPVATLSVSSTGTISDVDIPDFPSSMMLCQDDLFILPGFPVPCDILPVHRMIGETKPPSKIYHVKRSTGAQSFEDILEVQTYPVDYDTANANGWVKFTQSEFSATGSYQVVKVINQRTGEELLMQLWTSGSDWWVFEKSQFRKSWRLP